MRFNIRDKEYIDINNNVFIYLENSKNIDEISFCWYNERLLYVKSIENKVLNIPYNNINEVYRFIEYIFRFIINKFNRENKKFEILFINYRFDMIIKENNVYRINIFNGSHRNTVNSMTTLKIVASNNHNEIIKTLENINDVLVINAKWELKYTNESKNEIDEIVKSFNIK